MAGSFPAALGPACLRFLRPIRVVGCGGGSYLGLSFYSLLDKCVINKQIAVLPFYLCHLCLLLAVRRPYQIGFVPIHVSQGSVAELSPYHFDRSLTAIKTEDETEDAERET